MENEYYTTLCCAMTPRRVIRTSEDKPGKVCEPVETEPKGWICPRCGKSNSPEVRVCGCLILPGTLDQPNTFPGLNPFVNPFVEPLSPSLPNTGGWPGSGVTVTTDNVTWRFANELILGGSNGS
jgi:hypothetical protein